MNPWGSDAYTSSVSQSSVAVILYGAPGCHLCDDARSLLRDLARRVSVEVSEVNIHTSIDLQRTYGVRIPVLRRDSGAELDWPFDLHTLELFMNAPAA